MNQSKDSQQNSQKTYYVSGDFTRITENSWDVVYLSWNFKVFGTILKKTKSVFTQQHDVTKEFAAAIYTNSILLLS